MHELLFWCTSYQQLATTYELLTCGKAAGFENVRWWRLFVFKCLRMRENLSSDMMLVAVHLRMDSVT